MLIVDSALDARERSGEPIRVAQFAAGHMGRAMVKQIERHMTGMELSVLYNRTLSKAFAAFEAAGVDDAVEARSVSHAEGLIAQGRRVVTDDPTIATRVDQVEAILEVTGDVAFAASVTLDAIDHGKHIVLQNAELDATVGPILNHKADRAGLVYTQGDGDQPGVTLNLFRWVKSIGVRPLLAGNLKGMLDHYRTPDTQAAFAQAHGLTPQMATNFADGTKLSFEMALIGNATGFGPLTRGMRGPRAGFVSEATGLFELDELLASGGCIDYLLGAEPAPGVFVLGYEPDVDRASYLTYFKMGQGPLFCFYVPYHLPHLESPLSVARAVLFRDATCASRGAPVVDVIALAKRDLKAGDVLDGIGGFTCYGAIERYDASVSEGWLPMGLTAGCRLKRPVARDQPIRAADVEMPEGGLPARLRAEQEQLFGVPDRRSMLGACQ